jgi:urease accessory protein
MMDKLLHLLQLCDSNFPSGSYTQSFGLETYVQEGTVRDSETFYEYLREYLYGPLRYTDGLAFRFAYHAAEACAVERIWHLDELLAVQSLASEARIGVRRMGERLVALTSELFPDNRLLSAYKQQIQARQASGHPSIVYALLVQHLGIGMESALAGYLYMCVSAQVQNGVRAIPLGQTQGQHLLLRVQPSVLDCAKSIGELTLEDFGVVSPGLELAQMRHEQLNVRIFMS